MSVAFKCLLAITATMAFSPELKPFYESDTTERATADFFDDHAALEDRKPIEASMLRGSKVPGWAAMPTTVLNRFAGNPLEAKARKLHAKSLTAKSAKEFRKLQHAAAHAEKQNMNFQIAGTVGNGLTALMSANLPKLNPEPYDRSAQDARARCSRMRHAAQEQTAAQSTDDHEIGLDQQFSTSEQPALASDALAELKQAQKEYTTATSRRVYAHTVAKTTESGWLRWRSNDAANAIFTAIESGLAHKRYKQHTMYAQNANLLFALLQSPSFKKELGVTSWKKTAEARIKTANLAMKLGIAGSFAGATLSALFPYLSLNENGPHLALHNEPVPVSSIKTVLASKALMWTGVIARKLTHLRSRRQCEAPGLEKAFNEAIENGIDGYTAEDCKEQLAADTEEHAVAL